MLMMLLKSRSALSYAIARVNNDEEGQTLIEYALLATLIAIAAIVLMFAVGFDIQETFDEVENALGLGTNGAAPVGDDDGAPQ